MQNIIRISFSIECFTKKAFNILLVSKKTLIDVCERALWEFIYLSRQLIMNIAVEPKHGFVVVVLLFVLINGGTRHNLAYIDFAVLYGMSTAMHGFKQLSMNIVAIVTCFSSS